MKDSIKTPRPADVNGVPFDMPGFIAEYDNILARGLCKGAGVQGKRVCIEAAICEALGLQHDDDPGCVATAVREFKIQLNDSNWSSPAARAEGLRDLGLAQLGSKEVVSNSEFTERLAIKTRDVLCRELADMSNVPSAWQTETFRIAGDAFLSSLNAAMAANYAKTAVGHPLNDEDDYFLRLSAALALEVLIELRSPGVRYISDNAVEKLKTKTKGQNQ